jgi:hypothetical protein
LRVVTYEDALNESAGHRRHLLLGNGFSIAASPGFRYASLFEEAFGGGDERLRQIFDRIGTTDFEQVLSCLDTATEVLACYPQAAETALEIQNDRRLIARRLIEAIARTHPGTARDIADARYEGAGRFLADMRRPTAEGLDGQIFTTNYDLLLYWATMRAWAAVRTRDGFGDGAAGLVWTEGGVQSVFHLHGALHMFVGPDGAITKLRWDRPLIEQIGRHIDRDLLPLFVSEGTSAQKVERIQESPYLRHALSNFQAACADPEAVLFVFGSAFNDDHIVELIAEGGIRRVYVSATDTNAGRLAMAAHEAQWLERRRLNGLPEVEVVVFAAEEAAPWG